MFLEQFVRII